MGNNHITIAVVEDDPDTLEVLRFNLDLEGYRVQAFSDGEEALEQLLREPPDLLILDLMLPGMGGLDIARALRSESHTRDLPILMLTARSAEEDVVLGFQRGADDYLAKPFRIRELLARVRALLRRAGKLDKKKIRFRDLYIDLEQNTARDERGTIQLRPKEHRLLLALFEAQGKLLRREEILDRAWGYDYYGDPRTVDVHIRRLREKLGPNADLIQTVKGFGYRLHPDVFEEKP